MNLQNGYKAVYEKAADGKRTFYASKTGLYDSSVDTLGTLVDANFAGRTIYEHDNNFYASVAGAAPAYDENGLPLDGRISLFDPIFGEFANRYYILEPTAFTCRYNFYPGAMGQDLDCIVEFDGVGYSAHMEGYEAASNFFWNISCEKLPDIEISGDTSGGDVIAADDLEHTIAIYYYVDTNPMAISETDADSTVVSDTEVTENSGTEAVNTEDE